MASAELSRRVEKVVGFPPLSELGRLQRREFHEALLEASSFEDLPGKWQAAIREAEQNRPKLRVVRGTQSRQGRRRGGTSPHRESDDLERQVATGPATHSRSSEAMAGAGRRHLDRLLKTA
jgi:hypothetical protein